MQSVWYFSYSIKADLCSAAFFGVEIDVSPLDGWAKFYPCLLSLIFRRPLQAFIRFPESSGRGALSRAYAHGQTVVVCKGKTCCAAMYIWLWDGCTALLVFSPVFRLTVSLFLSFCCRHLENFLLRPAKNQAAVAVGSKGQKNIVVALAHGFLGDRLDNVGKHLEQDRWLFLYCTLLLQ